MENQPMTNPSDVSSVNTIPVNQSPIPVQAKTNLIVPILLTTLMSGLVFGIGGYYLGKHAIGSQPNLEYNQIPPTPTTASQFLSSPTPNDKQLSVLPTGWSYKSNNECGVKFAIPPKAIPYISSDGRFWDFPRGGVYPNLLTKFPNGYDEHKQAVTMFASSDEASGYVSQAVVVSCIPNNGRLTDNSQLLSSLTAELNKYNSSTGEKGMQAATYSIKSNSPTQRWGKDVLDFVVAEDTTNVSYTMFVTPQFVYEVKLFGAIEDNSVKNTGKQIFDNLSF